MACVRLNLRTQNEVSLEVFLKMFENSTLIVFDLTTQTNLRISSHEVHWRTHQGIRDMKVAKLTSKFQRKEQHDLKRYPVTPSARGAQYMSLIIHA